MVGLVTGEHEAGASYILIDWKQRKEVVNRGWVTFYPIHNDLFLQVSSHSLGPLTITTTETKEKRKEKKTKEGRKGKKRAINWRPGVQKIGRHFRVKQYQGISDFSGNVQFYFILFLFKTIFHSHQGFVKDNSQA